MNLTPDQLAAIESIVNTSDEQVLVVFVNPIGRMTAATGPHTEAIEKWYDDAWGGGVPLAVGEGGSLTEAMASLGADIKDNQAEMNPDFFKPEEGDPHG